MVNGWSCHTSHLQLLAAQGKFSEAEPLFRRALAIDTKVYGPDHLRVAATLSNLGNLWEGQV